MVSDSSISAPNLKVTIKAVSLAVYFHLKHRRRERDRRVAGQREPSLAKELDVFDERIHPVLVRLCLLSPSPSPSLSPSPSPSPSPPCLPHAHDKHSLADTTCIPLVPVSCFSSGTVVSFESQSQSVVAVGGVS